MEEFEKIQQKNSLICEKTFIQKQQFIEMLQNLNFVAIEKANIDCIKDNWSGINDYGYYLELQNKISEFLNSDNNKEYRLENNVPATNLIFDFYAWIEGGGKDNLKEHWSYKAKEYEFYSNNKELINTILEKL